MTASGLNTKEKEIMEEIPMVKDSSGVYFYTVKSKTDANLVGILDKMIGINDTRLSKWLNITPRTYRNYRNNPELVLKDTTKEHIILIISLYKHGAEVFGGVQEFEAWLSKKNPLLSHKTPQEFLETISGIKFIDSRLTAIEFGENA